MTLEVLGTGKETDMQFGRLRFWQMFAVSAVFANTLGSAVAGLGPENVAVVVNADSWASLTIANAYIAGRKIPSRNVIYLEDVSGYETIGVDEFREKLLKPVLKTIAERRLTDQIDCIAWSADFPYGVDVAADVAAAKVKLPQVLTTTASINGLTYLHELVLKKDPRYLDLNSNWYFRKAIRAGLQKNAGKPAAVVTDAEIAKFRDAVKLIQQKKWAEATPLLQELFDAHPTEIQVGYNLACSLAQEGKADDAMKALARAVGAGWFDRAHTEKDDDLKTLRDRDDFKQLLTKMNPPLFEVEPSIGFRSVYRWNDKGERVEEEGRQYLLSTVLAVTSGRGTSLDEALTTLKSSRESPQADADVRLGTVYFVKNGDVRSRTREWAFASVVEKLREMKVKAEIVDGTLPVNKKDVAGAVIGIADFDWPGSGSRILPGAIVEHLTSFGGVLREHSGQTPLTAFVRHGAAGASGTVTEPYAIQAKFPSPFIHVHYAAGATLAEAFYLSVQGPYQLLIVGDPLCAPWATRPKAELTVQPDKITNEPSLKVAVQPPKAGGDELGSYEISIDGRRVITTPQGASHFDLPIQELDGGWHEIRLTGVSASPLEVRGVPDAIVSFEIDRGPKVDLHRGNPFPHAIPDVLKFGANEIVLIDLIAPGADVVQLEFGGRIVASLPGERQPHEWRTVGVPALAFGAGEIPIVAIAETKDGKRRSEVEYAVVGNEPSSGRILKKLEPIGWELREGIQLKAANQEAVLVTDLRDGNWLATRKLPAGTHFTLEGLFETNERFSQFQTESNCRIQLEVDGVPIRASGTGRWEYRPLWAEPGLHRMTISGTIPENGEPPRLAARYGGSGTQSLDGKRFRNPAEAK